MCILSVLTSSPLSIGYPVVTMSFLIKHQIMHVIRQRQQKRIAEENAVYFDVLQKALPQEPSRTSDENDKDRIAVEEGAMSSSGVQSDHRDGRPRISPKTNHGGGMGGGGGGKMSNHRERLSSSSGGKHNRSGGVKTQDHRSNSSKQQVSQQSDHQSLSQGSSVVATPNGDIPRPSSAGKVHVVSGKKQLAVKAVPRSNQLAQATATTPTGNTQDIVKDKVMW